MQRPVLSICIPTFNRATYLKECLKSIVSQLKNKDFQKVVEVVVSDNDSTDNTCDIVKNFNKKFKNIKYFKNKKNIGGDRNIIKAASYATGDYIWFFGDDDMHYPDSLREVTDIIKKKHPDAMICNLNLFSTSGDKVIEKNLLNLDLDVLVKTKKELFRFLETKFFLSIEWYMTCMSCIIVSRKIFKANIRGILKNHDPTKNAFLHTGIIYYNRDDYRIYMIRKPLVKYRAYNIRMLGPNERDDKVGHYSMISNVFSEHNKTIYKINKENMSKKFKTLRYLKGLSRQVRILFLKYFNFDISEGLIRLFERKN